MAIAASISALNEWEFALVVVGDVSGGSVSGIGLVGLRVLLLLVLLLLLLFEVFDFLNFLNVSGGLSVLLEERIEVVGVSWVELSLQGSEIDADFLNVSDGELGGDARADGLGVAANLVAWVVQALSVLWAALESGSRFEWVQEVSEAG